MQNSENSFIGIPIDINFNQFIDFSNRVQIFNQLSESLDL
jgi:hypothetical protein